MVKLFWSREHCACVGSVVLLVVNLLATDPYHCGAASGNRLAACSERTATLQGDRSRPEQGPCACFSRS